MTTRTCCAPDCGAPATHELGKFATSDSSTDACAAHVGTLAEDGDKVFFIRADGMTHEQKIAWMHEWAAKNGATIRLEGECGFGRECVGLIVADKYPEYIWYSDEYDRIDNNGDVWAPEDAYHKYSCVTVLGRGEGAESQLFDWLRWFDANGFTVQTGKIPRTFRNNIQLMITGDTWARMVKVSP